MDKNTRVKINKVLRPLSELPTQIYYDNSLQVVDVLEWTLEQVGSAKVMQTSFSMAGEFLSRLYQLRKSNKVVITEHIVVLDNRATAQTMKLWQNIKRVIQKVYLSKTHAKFMLIEGDNGMKVTMLTSQNLTRGNRYESAIITMDECVYDSLKMQTELLIKNYSRPFNELTGGSDDGHEIYDSLQNDISNI